MDDDQDQNPCSKPQRIVQEIDFFDDQRPKRIFSSPSTKPCVEEIFFREIFKPIMSSPQKRARVQETDVQEISLSLVDVSTDNDQKKRKIIDDFRKGFEAVLDCYNSTVIRLFGVDVTSDSTSGINDYDQEKSSKAKGKEKIIYDHQEPEAAVDINSPSFLIVDKLCASRGKGICINEEKNKDKKKKTNSSKLGNSTVQQEQQPAELNPRILQEIQQHGGSELVFLFEKKLEISDVNNGLNRVFITRSQKLMVALTEEERQKVEDRKDRLRVFTIDPQGEEYTLHLKRWHAVGVVVLNHEWRKLVMANRLQKDDCVQGWGYRRQGEFCLALNIIKKAHQDLASNVNGGSSSSRDEFVAVLKVDMISRHCP